MLGSLLYRNKLRSTQEEADTRVLPRAAIFFNQASFRQTSLVSTNKSRFDKRVSILEQTSLVEKSFIEWLINRDD